MSKAHNNCIKFHKRQLEEKHDYKCKKEFDVGVNGAVHHIDLGCFCEKKPPVAMEVETSKNWNCPQVQSNKNDLKEFEKCYPGSKTFHIKASEKVDFEKELKPIPKPRPRGNVLVSRRFR